MATTENNFFTTVGVSLTIIIILNLTYPSAVLCQSITLESPRITNWGTWGVMHLCPTLTYIYGMRLKIHPDQGFFGDDSALNALEFLCISPQATAELRTNSTINQNFAVIRSSEGHQGNYGVVVECPFPGFALGFQLRSEEDRGWFDDDSAGNNLRLICTTGEVLEGYGLGWGIWTQEQRCPRGTQLCGIQTQIDPPSQSDDTTLNNINMGCCALP